METRGQPLPVQAPQAPLLEPVPVEGCRICAALARGRTAARLCRSPVSVQNYNDQIRHHPHRRATDWKGPQSDQLDTAPVSRRP
ncbi:hypothetical protein CFC35_24855 [Streptomyces sp. FBKL.4005]|nr:hypothetical protein CFC35_24855 [Streptomyces sp. FBKL.4005]